MNKITLSTGRVFETTAYMQAGVIEVTPTTAVHRLTEPELRELVLRQAGQIEGLLWQPRPRRP